MNDEQYMAAKAIIQMMNNVGVIPIDDCSTNVDSVQINRSSLDDAYELLQYSTELFLADVISKGVFIKIKYLIDTMDSENHEMARKILHAKAEK